MAGAGPGSGRGLASLEMRSRRQEASKRDWAGVRLKTAGTPAIRLFSLPELGRPRWEFQPGSGCTWIRAGSRLGISAGLGPAPALEWLGPAMHAKLDFFSLENAKSELVELSACKNEFQSS